MKALKISVNGQVIAIAGSEECRILSTDVIDSFDDSAGGFTLTVGGSTGTGHTNENYDLLWIKQLVLVDGDEIEIEAVETNLPTSPLKRFPRNN